MRGAADLDGEDGLSLNRSKGLISLSVKIKDFIVWVADSITPLKSTVKKISLEQDKSIYSFFVTYRFLI
jgi:hypothetical protein